MNRVWQPPPGAVPNAPGQVSLWQVLWQRRLLLLLSTLVGLAAGATFCLLAPASYQSSAQVLVVQKRPDAMTGLDTRQVSLEDYMETHQELVKSLLILDRAVHEGKLDSLPSLEQATGPLPEAMQRQLTVNRKKGPGGSNNVLQITFQGRSADDCPAVLCAILAAYRAFLEQKYHSITSDTLDLLIRDRAGLLDELARKEAAYQKLLEARPLLARTRDGPDLRKDRINLIQARQAALLLRRTELQSQLAAIAAARKQGNSRESLLAMIADFSRKEDAADLGKEPAAGQEQLSPLLLEEQKLLERYGPDHPEVKSVRRRIAIARGLLVLPRTSWGRAVGADGEAAAAAVIDTHVQILTQKLKQVSLAEEGLEEVFRSEQDEARRLASYEVREESLRTGILLLRQSFEAINKRLQDVSLVKGAGGYDVEVIGPPSSGRKVFPRPALVLPLALVLGFLAGVGLVWLREMTVPERLDPPVADCLPPTQPSAVAAGTTDSPEQGNGAPLPSQ